MKTAYPFLLSVLLTGLIQNSNAQTSPYPISTDTSSCFLFMEVDGISRQGISIYHGNGTIDHFTARVEKDEKIDYKGYWSRAIAEISDSLYRQGWRLVSVTDDNDEASSIDVPRYYYFERVGCGKDR